MDNNSHKTIFIPKITFDKKQSKIFKNRKIYAASVAVLFLIAVVLNFVSIFNLSNQFILKVGDRSNGGATQTIQWVTQFLPFLLMICFIVVVLVSLSFILANVLHNLIDDTYLGHLIDKPKDLMDSSYSEAKRKINNENVLKLSRSMTINKISIMDDFMLIVIVLLNWFSNYSSQSVFVSFSLLYTVLLQTFLVNLKSRMISGDLEIAEVDSESANEFELVKTK